MIHRIRRPYRRGLPRLALCSVLFSAALTAQTGPLGPPLPASSPQQPVKRDLYGILEDLRAAIRNDDWSEASRLAFRLNSSLIVPRQTSGQMMPDIELAHVELMAGKDATTRTPLLARLAHAAFAAGNRRKAEEYANAALQASASGTFWWTGDAIHQGNIVLGRLALARDDVPSAVERLLAAGRTPGSSSLVAFGPNMALAADLADRGETRAVIRYLEECRDFWTTGQRKLAEWIALLRAGLKPDFGRNVEY